MRAQAPDQNKTFHLSIDAISPHVRFVSEYKAEPDFRFRERILYDHLIEYIYDGKGQYIVQNEKVPVYRGDVVLIPPGVVHSIEADHETPFVRQCVHFDFSYVGGYDSMPWWEWFPEPLKDDKIHPTPVFSEELRLPSVSRLLHVPKIRPLFARLFREMYHKEAGYKLAVKACMLDILLLIHRNALPGELRSEETPLVIPNAIADAKRFMERNLSRKLTLAAIAEVTHYHPVHFERLFKRSMGCSPIEYLLELRISKAKEFLEDSDLNISEIAAEAGFDSSQYFSLVFKKLVGFSPRHYRRLIRESGVSGICLPLAHLEEYPTQKMFSHTSPEPPAKNA
ncbi:MAG: AraC family transcriptional regulator [Candidatus Latescibacteria bacterium]|nr:AraC family transcriptional regulator [Candidatus Latescibacterota bacterium]